MSFEKNEKKLKKLLDIDVEPFDYPIPIFVPVVIAWLFILLFPIIIISDSSNISNHEFHFRSLMGFYLPLVMTALIFQINQKYLVPSCIFKKHYAMYFVWNTLLILVALFIREVVFFIFDKTSSEGWNYFFSTYCFSFVKGHFTIWTLVSFVILVSFVCVTCVLYHIMIRQIIKSFIRREQKRTRLQYELDFLKNQLSPHFLFNTLNNIAALIQMDSKRAEASMIKLSKLLRVMLYQTSDEMISIVEDVDILKKYGELEKLRLNDNFDFSFDVELENTNAQIAPLIAMPLMENALKHSVNPNGNSFAHISISQKEQEFIFKSENSYFPKKSKEKSSGLGLVTLRKRLELLYMDKFEYTTSLKDGVYCSTLKIILENSQN